MPLVVLAVRGLSSARVGIRANPKDVPHPVFVMLGSWEPGVLRDLGI